MDIEDIHEPTEKEDSMETMTTGKSTPESLAPLNKQGTQHIFRWARKRVADGAPLLTLIVLVAFFSLTTDSFLSSINLLNILAQVSILSIVATGMTFVLLCGEIDLSVAAVATMSGVIAATLFYANQWPQGIAILVGLVIAGIFGVVTGWGTTKVGLPSFMMSLVALQVADGISLFVSKGTINYHIPPFLTHMGSDRLKAYIGQIPVLGNINVVILVAVVVLVLGHVVLTYTRFGRYVYMTGSNRIGAEFSGVNTKLIVGACMAISGLCAGFGGMLNAGRLGSAQPNSSVTTILLDSITAVVLGGTALTGGRGGVKNTVIGLLVFGVLSNGLDLIQLDIYIRTLIAGLILLIALLINNYALKLRQVVTEAEEAPVLHKAPMKEGSSA